MTDYFNTICDWEDEDDSWRPTAYLMVDDVVLLGGVEYEYQYIERDHWILGNTIEENLALGRTHVINLKRLNIYTHGKTFEQALERVLETYALGCYTKET